MTLPSVEPPASPASALPLYTAARRAFAQACDRLGGPVEHRLGVGGHVVRLVSAGPALADILTRPLHPAPEATAEPALTIRVLDSQSSGLPLPPLPWPPDAQFTRNEAPGFHRDHTLLAAFQAEAGLLSLYLPAQREAIVWARSADGLPDYERAAPLRLLFSWWAETVGLQLVHAGAVGRPDGGVLLAGRGGSGKSTSTLACLGSRLQLAGDDYVLVRPGAAPHIFSLYASAKLTPTSLTWLPHLAPLVANDRPPDEKALLFLRPHAAASLCEGFPLRAILLPRVSGAASRLTPASPAVALRLLAPSTIFQLAGADGTTLTRLAQLVRAAPCYALDLGPDLIRLPDLFESLLS